MVKLLFTYSLQIYLFSLKWMLVNKKRVDLSAINQSSLWFPWEKRHDYCILKFSQYWSFYYEICKNPTVQSKIDKNTQPDASLEKNVDYIEDFEIQDETTKTDISEETSDFVSTKTNDVTKKTPPRENNENPQIQTTEKPSSTTSKESICIY